MSLEGAELHDHYTSIDLFAGGGGLTEGFKYCGYRPLFANDFEEPSLKTYKRNHPEAAISADPVEDLDPQRIREDLDLREGALDVLLGGPPCQGFSTYGERDPGDPRNNLYEYFGAFLGEFKPKAYVMENVTGLLSMEGGAVVEAIRDSFEDRGYSSKVLKLDAVDYGVPQYRERVFIVGARHDASIEKPRPTHTSDGQGSLFSADGRKAPVTVEDAIGGLPDEVYPPKKTHEPMEYPEGERTEYARQIRNGADTLTHHSAKQMLGIRRIRLALLKPGEYGAQIRKRIREDGLPEEVIDELLNGGYKLRDLSQVRKQDRKKERKLRRLLKEGHREVEEILEELDMGGFRNKYRRLEWDEPSHTLVAHMARDCSDFVHPEIDRFISVREAARLQSFPDTYYFCESQFRQFRAIGNAVPPLLAKAVAESVTEAIGETPQTFERETATSDVSDGET